MESIAGTGWCQLMLGKGVRQLGEEGETGGRGHEGQEPERKEENRPDWLSKGKHGKVLIHFICGQFPNVIIII